MSKLEKLRGARIALVEAELAYEKEVFLNKPQYWTLNNDVLCFHDVYYDSERHMPQVKVADEDKNTLWTNYELLLRKKKL